ncbi:hypothetical protein [Clostridium sp. C2-6-12]|uniref:hypothetical protein n=1 Tax=Clostridium sp. C2-6-12 TaxID=2698832 RepID=UPI001A9ACE5C|nr:hypothetical protein [Clostridium sp. C2-6-12]
MVTNINQSTIDLIVNISLVIVIMLIVNEYVRKSIKYMINFITIISIGMLLFRYSLFNYENIYFYFDAPDKSHTLVVEESSFLLAGRSTFYKREGFIFIKDLNNSITTDDGYRPFSNNHYDLKWLENKSVELSYDYGAGKSEYKKEIITFD